MPGLFTKWTSRFKKEPSKAAFEEEFSSKEKTPVSETSPQTSFFHSWNRLFQRRKFDESLLAEIEELLYTADFGVEATDKVIEAIHLAYKKDKSLSGQSAAGIASKVLKELLQGAEGQLTLNKQQKPSVICLIGVNGSGKTTTAAKLAYRWKTEGQRCLLGACDTFRAAANEQIKSWAQRLEIELVSSQQNADPAAVAFDAYSAALHRNCDTLILDTAGRLHTKTGLLTELQKLCRVLKKQNPSAPHHIWLVADANLGSNTIEQALTFHKKLNINGLILTKLDSTSKGGAFVGIYQKLKLPCYFVGFGEQPEDLESFSIEAYIDAIFPQDESLGDKA